MVMFVRRKNDSYWRLWVVVACLVLGAILLMSRSVYLHVVNQPFLKSEADKRQIRTVTIPAPRGMILDRRDNPLAVSIPVKSVALDPRFVVNTPENWALISRYTGVSTDDLLDLYHDARDRKFVYVQRHLHPLDVAPLMAANLPGVSFHDEYKRIYPGGRAFSNLIGVSNVDDRGIEGVELASNEQLTGHEGKRRVLKDGHSRVIRDLGLLDAPAQGQDVTLSLDQRLQFVAHQSLQEMIEKTNAESGSVVALSVDTGEILAMVSAPDFDPGDRKSIRMEGLKNRSVSDLFEPGSTIKPFVVAAGLENGVVNSFSQIDSEKGRFRVHNLTVRDHRDYGVLTLTKLLAKSSNVGAAKIGLALEPSVLEKTLEQVGFASAPAIDLPGIQRGRLRWPRYPVERATLAYGYGMSITTLQLAEAYYVLAANGIKRPVTIFKNDQVPEGERVMSAQVAQRIRGMLEAVVSEDGTGKKAAVPGYRVAGKTGTSRKLIDGTYGHSRYVSLFAGMAPANNPKVVVAVMVNDPRGNRFYGGDVAAPIFSKVAHAALLLNGVPPAFATHQLADLGDGLGIGESGTGGPRS